MNGNKYIMKPVVDISEAENLDNNSLIYTKTRDEISKSILAIKKEKEALIIKALEKNGINIDLRIPENAKKISINYYADKTEKVYYTFSSGEKIHLVTFYPSEPEFENNTVIIGFKHTL